MARAAQRGVMRKTPPRGFLALVRFHTPTIAFVISVLGLVVLSFSMIEKAYPRYFFGVSAVLVMAPIIRMLYITRRNRSRGWRVGHSGRDSMFYDELRNGTWHRIDIGGELLKGTPHHVIYITHMQYPEWATGRSGEIVGRIKSVFKATEYAYDDGGTW